MIALAEPDFPAETAIEKALFDTGFRRHLPPLADGVWRIGASSHEGIGGRVAVAALAPLTGRRYALRLFGFPDELTAMLATEFTVDPVAATVSCADAATLTQALRRVWQIAKSLPATPLHAFRTALAAASIDPDAPPATEAERLTRVRIGQATFRAALLDYWGGTCPLTGITEPALLRASHIVPWAACTSDAQRLDVHNGLLLSALWDAAFDAGLVTFEGDGRPLASDALASSARAALALDAAPPLPLTDAHRTALGWHRHNLFDRKD